MQDSFIVNGVAFKKTFSYAGFEQQPKSFMKPKIILLNIELELNPRRKMLKSISSFFVPRTYTSCFVV
ncbi:hypothetical protein KSP39_PZI019115 [Platanthera zijinensis]|uniref:Uncharacterized protein n=1 Tax=Platanthera zijinensis TaxID=2320716 RepID=A0AAP0FY43_9ASPA